MSGDSRFPRSECRGCGAPIIWGVDEKGQRHPLDAKAPCYLAVQDVRGVHVKRLREAFVSHFVTCPKRDEFRKPKPADAGEQETW